MTASEFVGGANEDPLWDFMQMTQERFQQMRRDLPQYWARLLGIDWAFSRICTNLKEPRDLLPAILLLRSHSAYRAGVQLARSGQIPERD